MQLRGTRTLQIGTALLLTLIGGAAIELRSLQAQSGADRADPYIWLEDVSGARSMSWVKTENERTAKMLENDPRYAELKSAALKTLEAPDRLPTPSLNGSDVYNTWQDAQH